MKQFVHAPTALDFVAAVPSILGFTVRNSLVCVAFGGSRSAGAVRFDLPKRLRTSDYRAIASAAIGMLGRMPGVDGVTPVIYTDKTFLGERGIPWLDFQRMLVSRFKDSGFHLPYALCVAADGWGSYFDPDGPREGRPLAQLEASTVGKEARAIRNENPQDISELAALPMPNALQRHNVEQTLEILRTGNDDACDMVLDRLELLGELDPVSWVETCLNADSMSADTTAWLLHLVQSPANRDAMMLQFAFGKEVGQATSRINEHYKSIQRSSGKAMDEVVMAEIEAGRASLHDWIGNLLMGESATRPQVERTVAAIGILKHACAHAPEELQPASLCMLAWLSWALGLGSAAGTFVDAALVIEPDYGMAQVIFGLISSGRVPEWAFAAG
jgi:hypothetical protein